MRDFLLKEVREAAVAVYGPQLLNYKPRQPCEERRIKRNKEKADAIANHNVHSAVLDLSQLVNDYCMAKEKENTYHTRTKRTRPPTRF